MADATSTFTVRGQADVDDAVRGLNRLGDEAEKAGDKAKGMGDYFRATVAGILSAETAMKGLEIVLGAAGAAFDFARDATLEYMQSTAEGRAQVSLFTTEIGKLKTAIGESVTNSEAFGDGFDAAIEVLRDLTEILPGVIQTLDNYYLTAVKVEEVTSGFASAMNTLGGALYNLTPFAAVENAFTLVGTAANNVTEIVGEAEREVRVIAEAAAAATEPINGFGTAWLEATSSINTANAALSAMNLTDFFFGVAEEAPPATEAVRGYAAAIDMAVVAAEKLKKAQEDAAQAMRELNEYMQRKAKEANEDAVAAAEERAAEEERIAAERAVAAEAAAAEAKRKIAAALTGGEEEGGGGFFDVQKLEKDYDAMEEATSAFEGTASGLGSSLSSSFGAALGSTENFGKAFKAALGQALVSQGITEILTGISNMIPFGPMFNPVAGAARLAGGSTMLAIGKAMGGKGSAPGGAGGGGRSAGESSGLTPMAQPQRQGPTNLIDYTGVTIVTNDTDSMRTLIDRQARTATAGAGSRV
jgi:hypothetical protein